MNVFKKVCAILSDVLEYDEEITLRTRLVQDLGADSFHATEIMDQIEEEFEIEIEEEVASEMSTVEDVVNYIEDRI